MGSGYKLGLVLCCKSKGRPVSDSFDRTKGDLDPLFVGPVDIATDRFDELLNGCGLQVLSGVGAQIDIPIPK